MTDTIHRSVTGHIGFAVLAGGLTGGGIAAIGALPALVLQWMRSGPPDAAAWWGMPATLGAMGAVVGLAAGLLSGLSTLGLRSGATRRTRRSVAVALAVVFGTPGGALLSLFWMGAADSGGIVVVPGAITFCSALTFVAADAILARLVRSPGGLALNADS